MANPFVHVELHTHDPKRAKKLYAELFDWKLEDFPEMNYTIIKVGEGTGGGIMKTVHTFLTICACAYCRPANLLKRELSSTRLFGPSPLDWLNGN